MTDREGFYVAARLLEEVAKAEGDTEGAAVCARVAERVADGHDAADAVGSVATDADDQTRRRLRLAFEEVRGDGSAGIVEKTDDGVVARLRSEFEA